MTSTENVEFTGLAALRNRKKAKQDAAESRDRPDAVWFKINPNEVLTVRFLQELDESSPNYNEAFGTYKGMSEHNAHGKSGFQSRATCTKETDPEGRCYPHEMIKATGELGWKLKENFYINVAVDRGGDKPSVEILSRNLHSSFVDDLGDECDDNENSITDKTWTIIRKGAGTDTKWKLKESKEDLDVSGLEVWDLDVYVPRNIPYEKQKEWFAKNYTPDAPKEDSDTSSDNNVGEDAPSW